MCSRTTPRQLGRFSGEPWSQLLLLVEPQILCRVEGELHAQVPSPVPSQGLCKSPSCWIAISVAISCCPAGKQRQLKGMQISGYACLTMWCDAIDGGHTVSGG
jgi:hypothetical protein